MAQQQPRTAATRQQQRAKANSPAQRQRTPRSLKGASGVKPFNMPFERKNIVFILIGIGVVTLGYVIMGLSETMGFMALDVSPIVLLLGYLVVIPMGIMYGAHRKKVEAPAEEATAVQ
ncbi:MAG: hypothetical protein Q8916_07845 [Bacteroidota bacterium]|nr:hypothetical protein [Bacteroidota bacterium]MDP4230299.1 hypothetical protein [Bacteroidota bacterium]MDP4235614.1 hypothetical protein [Bacteroidota bacterium]